MPKAITLEMLHDMSPEQRKTLHANASVMDTPASRAVLDLLKQDNLMPAPKLAKAPVKRKTAARKMSPAAKAPVARKKTVSYGRQS